MHEAARKIEVGLSSIRRAIALLRHCVREAERFGASVWGGIAA